MSGLAEGAIVAVVAALEALTAGDLGACEECLLAAEDTLAELQAVAA